MLRRRHKWWTREWVREKEKKRSLQHAAPSSVFWSYHPSLVSPSPKCRCCFFLLFRVTSGVCCSRCCVCSLRDSEDSWVCVGVSFYGLSGNDAFFHFLFCVRWRERKYFGANIWVSKRLVHSLVIARKLIASIRRIVVLGLRSCLRIPLEDYFWELSVE